jgi:hypothetical protein
MSQLSKLDAIKKKNLRIFIDEFRDAHRVCACAWVWVCGCVGVWLCGCVVVWLCGCVGVCVCACVKGSIFNPLTPRG